MTGFGCCACNVDLLAFTLCSGTVVWIVGVSFTWCGSKFVFRELRSLQNTGWAFGAVSEGFVACAFFPARSLLEFVSPRT